PRFRGLDPRAVVDEAYAKALEMGRVRREDYPVLEDFRAGEAGCGRATPAGAATPFRASWRTHVPLKAARLIADGQTVLALEGDGRTEVRWEGTLDTRGKRSLRLEVEAAAPHDATQVEYLLANPVYLEN
ncbi:MAG: hypothetical protein KIS92_14410, partial [Planctomycetota bacterium]|nr:hypothetical protein [Planctomycetota bacterium]